MKKIQFKYILSLVLTFGLLTSCKDESKWVYDTSKLPAGAYARMLALAPSTAAIATFDATDFPFQAEISGVSTAAQVTSLDIQVRYLNGADGTVIKDYAALGSITSWAIVPSTTALPRGSASFKGSDIRTALALLPGDLVTTNLIEFATTLKLADGRVYNASNFDPNMNNSFYGAAYDYVTALE